MFLSVLIFSIHKVLNAMFNFQEIRDIRTLGDIYQYYDFSLYIEVIRIFYIQISRCSSNFISQNQN